MELTLYTYRGQPEQLFQVSGNDIIIGRPKKHPDSSSFFPCKNLRITYFG